MVLFLGERSAREQDRDFVEAIIKDPSVGEAIAFDDEMHFAKIIETLVSSLRGHSVIVVIVHFVLLKGRAFYERSHYGIATDSDDETKVSAYSKRGYSFLNQIVRPDYYYPGSLGVPFCEVGVGC